MQNLTPLLRRLRQTTLPFEAASFHLVLMLCDKPGSFVSTATKTTIPPSIVGILSKMLVDA